MAMTPRAKPQPERHSDPAEGRVRTRSEAIVRAGLEAAERGDGIDLTDEEAEHYYGTGELPEHVQRAGDLWAERWRESRE
jgi:hypothetical protein